MEKEMTIDMPSHTLQIDEELYKDDDDMMYILHKLEALAKDPEVQKAMDREDRYYAAMQRLQGGKHQK